MYNLIKVCKLDFNKLNEVATILNACGKDMAKKYDLHHWDNPYIKTLIIVGLCNLKNDIYLLYEEDKPIATFMTKVNRESLHFEKLGTLTAKSGKGIGSICLEHIERIAFEKGCKSVAMEVYSPSKYAISFYEHRGYETVGVTDTLKYKEVKMEKGLL